MGAVHDLGDGVYFARRDYAGFLRRMFIVLIDLLVILVVGFLIQLTWNLARPEETSPITSIICLGLAYLYLTILRGTRLRTLGYILTGVKIINLKGERPSFFWMNLRLTLWIFGPVNPIVDLLWFWGDNNRQTLRDRLAGTYVIKRKAVPIGGGPIRPATLFIMGYTLVYPEVIRFLPLNFYARCGEVDRQ